MEKKLNYSNKEVNSLNETLKKKNDELIELRAASYEVDKMREAHAEYTRTVRESSQLNSEFEDNTILLQFKARYSGLK